MTEPLIEVVCAETGDRAEAEDERGAMLAARTLRNEARDNGCGVRPTLIFLVDGRTVAVRKGVLQ
jgi:hypothetical protein